MNEMNSKNEKKLKILYALATKTHTQKDKKNVKDHAGH